MVSRPPPGIVERLKQQAGENRDDGPGDDDPDQVARCDEVDKIAAGERSRRERRRAP